MRQRAISYWTAFALAQFFGYWIPTFTNIHSNMLPALAGLLVLPGCLLIFMFDFFTPWLIVLGVTVNALVAYILFRLLFSRSSTDKSADGASMLI